MSLDFFNRLLGFDEAKWKTASEETPIMRKTPPKVTTYLYDGRRPGVIEAADGVTIKFSLPRGGAKLLILPKLESK